MLQKMKPNTNPFHEGRGALMLSGVIADLQAAAAG